MADPPEEVRSAAWFRRCTPLWVTLGLLVALVVAAGAAVFFAVDASRAEREFRLLSDGVDRSRLPFDEAVALAELAGARSGPLPHDFRHAHDGDHGDMEMAHLGEEHHEALMAQLAEAAAVVPSLDTPAEAAAAGYVQAAGETDGVGAHWVKWSIVDRPFDPAAPSMLLFDELKAGKGPELIAYSYWVASADEPEGFPGGGDHWHRHFGLCFMNGWLRTDNAPRENCDGDWVNGSDLWMLHAWIVPGVENERGVFATVNPALCERSCVPVEWQPRPSLPPDASRRVGASGVSSAGG